MKTIRTVSAAYRKRQESPMEASACPKCGELNPTSPCIRCLSPAKILRLWVWWIDRLAAPPSHAGQALDVAKDGQTSVPGEQAIRRKLRLILLLCKHLTANEQRITRLRYTLSGGMVAYQREIPAELLGVAMEQEAEERVTKAEETEAPSAGCVRVKGIKNRFATWSQLARETGLSSKECKAHYEAAQYRVWKAQEMFDTVRWQAYMEALNEAQAD